MLDPQLLRAESELVAERLTVKKYILDVEKLGSLEDQRKGLQSEVQHLQAERNRSAKEVGRRKAAGEDLSALIEETSGLSGRISAIEKKLEGVRSALDELMHGIPNIPHESVPPAIAMKIMKRCVDGDPTTFAFEPADHVNLDPDSA